MLRISGRIIRPFFISGTGIRPEEEREGRKVRRDEKEGGKGNEKVKRRNREDEGERKRIRDK